MEPSFNFIGRAIVGSLARKTNQGNGRGQEMKSLKISGKTFKVVRENYADPVGDVKSFNVVSGPRGGEYYFWIYESGIGIVWNSRFNKEVAGPTRNFEING